MATINTMYAKDDILLQLDVIDDNNESLNPITTFLEVDFKDKFGKELACINYPEADKENSINCYPTTNEDGSISFTVVIPGNSFEPNTQLYSRMSTRIENEDLEDGFQTVTIQGWTDANIKLK